MTGRCNVIRAVYRMACTLGSGLSALVLVACGVGLSLGIEIGGPDDQPPAVSLAASVGSGAPGDSIDLVAAASDDYGVESVAFYRIEGDGSFTLLAVDTAVPYQTSTILVGTAGALARFVARATDVAGQRTESLPVTVQLR